MTHEAEYSPSGSELLLAIQGALGCLEWSETDWTTEEPLDGLGLYFDTHSHDLIKGELESFIAENQVDLDGLEYSQIGHDFILTRNHHGAGFWDRGLGERGERLTESAHAYGSITAFELNGELRAELS